VIPLHCTGPAFPAGSKQSQKSGGIASAKGKDSRQLAQLLGQVEHAGQGSHEEESEEKGEGQGKAEEGEEVIPIA
jgi:hypothetical protein